MKTSARNQFAGVVAALETGPVTTQVSVITTGGQEIVATITTAAATRLRLATGMAAIALVKASEIILVTEFGGYKMSARNQLEGKIARLERGPVSSLVVLTLPGGGSLTATVTSDAVDALGLAVGLPVTAAFKAYAVILAVARK